MTDREIKIVMREEGCVDHHTIARLRAGNPEAFDVVYMTYKNAITAFLFRLTGSEDLAEEITQVVFVTLWEKRAYLDPDQSVKSYLYKIAKNEVLMQGRHSSKYSNLPDGYEEEYTINTSHAPDEEYIANETRLLFEIALNRMPEQRKQVYQLKQEGLSYEEIAERLNISQESARKHWSRARKDLEALRTVILLFI